ncbi:glutathione-dependent formaldehyde dehydrogenase [Gigaspora margarita]|uniref:Glutathione-dependent formaldehyde dehydrogenase n=1 Tax=Gigaspora margarita TaxID=4874 RepID=A0A8H4AVZ0_GIGMA|nr:glutathione-dependent formaldehyde dehydrogenase [Gigaspora margarita]
MTEQIQTKFSVKAAKSSDTMRAVEWHGTTDIRVNLKRPRPVIIKPNDAIVRITATTICESDLHLYHKEIPRVAKGDIMGHEGMGIIHEVGSHVLKHKIGDRVVISSVIACGSCDYCKRAMFSCCNSNDSSENVEKSLGTQAEYVRVPFADINLIQISEEDNQILMEKALLLSSVACKGLYACEMSKILKGDVVGIWGADAVGIMCAAWAKYFGASRVIVIDSIHSRLQVALKIEGIEIINCKEDKDVVKKIKTSVPGGLDVAIDAVGIKYATKSFVGKLEKAFFADTENCDALEEAILCTKKGGNISLIGDYNTFTNHFRIGAVMDKSLAIRGGKSHSRNYRDIILPIMCENNLFTAIFTHHMNLSEATKAYKKLDKKEDGVIKILLIVDEKEFPHLTENSNSFPSGSRTRTVVEIANKNKLDEVVEAESGVIVMTVPSLSFEPINRSWSEPVCLSSFENNGLTQDTSISKSLDEVGSLKEEILVMSQKNIKSDVSRNELSEDGSHKKDEVKNE